MCQLMGFARSKTCELDSGVAVQVKDKSTILKGCNVPFFGVYLINNGRKIWISSADELKKACLIRDQIAAFLEEVAVKCSANGKTSASYR